MLIASEELNFLLMLAVTVTNSTEHTGHPKGAGGASCQSVRSPGCSQAGQARGKEQSLALLQQQAGPQWAWEHPMCGSVLYPEAG